MPWVVPLITAGIGVYQAAQSNKANKEAQREQKNLLAQRRAYRTPKELQDIQQLSQQNAQQGFSDRTMNYMTAQNDRLLSSSLDAARQAGGDPNLFSAMIQDSFQNIFRVGAESDLVKMRKFDSLLNATKMLADDRGAVWASEQNLIKDQMQLQAARGAQSQANLQSGVNTALQGITTFAQMMSDENRKRNGGSTAPAGLNGPTGFSSGNYNNNVSRTPTQVLQDNNTPYIF